MDYTQFPKISVIENKMQVEEMVQIDDIDLVSTCEHHFVTIDGSAKVAYIPGNKIIGLSKINRIVRFFAQRPQVQERLTQQILVALQTLLETDDVAVTINAVHYCVKASGVMDANSATATTALGGVFKTQPESRREFLMTLDYASATSFCRSPVIRAITYETYDCSATKFVDHALRVSARNSIEA